MGWLLEVSSSFTLGELFSGGSCTTVQVQEPLFFEEFLLKDYTIHRRCVWKKITV